MRIIGGKYKNAQLNTIDTPLLRPTTGRVKEALFNILTHNSDIIEDQPFYIDKNILDLCCGTGALGLECLSRGAKSVHFIDHSKDIVTLTKANSEKLKLHSSSCRFSCLTLPELPAAPMVYSLVFFDPPYGEESWILSTLNTLKKKLWVADDSLIVLEMKRNDKWNDFPGYCVKMTRDYGMTRLYFLQPTA